MMWREDPPELREIARRAWVWSCIDMPCSAITLILLAPPLRHLFWLGFIGPVTGYFRGAQFQRERELRLKLREAIYGAVSAENRRRVSLTIRQGGTITGDDVGVLWVEGGELHFEGLRTSFYLTKRLNHLARKVRRDKAQIVSFSAELEVKVEVTLKAEASTSIAGVVDSWWSAPCSKENSVLPPLDLGPQYRLSASDLLPKVLLVLVPLLVALVMSLGMRIGKITGFSLYTYDGLLLLFLFGGFAIARTIAKRARVDRMLKSRPWLVRRCE